MTDTNIRFHHIEPVPQTPGQAEDAALQLERDFVEIVRREIGMHEEMASLIAQAIVRGLRSRLGGQELYIPVPDRSARDAAIRDEFNGRNLDELMKRHGLSRSRIYEIVSKPGGACAGSPAFPLETGRPAGYGSTL